MDGGEHKGAGRVSTPRLHRVPQRLQAAEKALHPRLLPGQGQQQLHPALVAPLAGQVVPVAHVLDDALEGDKAGELRQLGQVGAQGLEPPRLPGLEAAPVDEGVQHRCPLRPPAQLLLEDAPLDAHLQLVVNPQKPLPIRAI